MKRSVAGIVDGGGFYFARVAAGGPYAFLASVAVDSSGAFAKEAIIAPPYDLSPSAQVRAQTRYIFQAYKDALGEVGASIDDVLQVEQYIERKVHADGYIQVSRGRDFMWHGRPASALIVTGSCPPDGCVVIPTAIAVIPDGGVKKEVLSRPGFHDGLTRPEYGEAFVHEGPFNEVTAAGPYVFTVGDVAVDYETGRLPEGVAVPQWQWWGNEVHNEAEFVLNREADRLRLAGARLEDAIHCTVYLVDMADLYELDIVWAERFPTDPPARTVVPVRNLGVGPRREGPNLGHAEGAVKMESIFRTLRPGHGATKEVISAGLSRLGHESEAVKAGPLLWISGRVAREAGSRDTTRQLREIFEELDAISRAAGTNLANTVRIRAFLTDPRESHLVYAAVKDAIPVDPPTVSVAGVPEPLQAPNASVLLDAVVYTEE